MNSMQEKHELNQSEIIIKKTSLNSIEKRHCEIVFLYLTTVVSIVHLLCDFEVVSSEVLLNAWLLIMMECSAA